MLWISCIMLMGIRCIIFVMLIILWMGVLFLCVMGLWGIGWGIILSVV